MSSILNFNVGFNRLQRLAKLWNLDPCLPDFSIYPLVITSISSFVKWPCHHVDWSQASLMFGKSTYWSYWLVVCNMNFIFHDMYIYIYILNIWDNPSQLTFIFFKMVIAPPTRICRKSTGEVMVFSQLKGGRNRAPREGPWFNYQAMGPSHPLN